MGKNLKKLQREERERGREGERESKGGREGGRGREGYSYHTAQFLYIMLHESIN